MMRILAIALAVTTTLAAAGCIGDPAKQQEKKGGLPTPPTDPDPIQAPPVAPPPPNVTRFNGSVSGVWVQNVGYVSPSDKHTFEFNVTNATRAILIEVAWKGGDKLSLKADVPAKYCTDSDPLGFLVSCPSPKPNDAGTSPARILITDPATLARGGTWTIGVWAQASSAEVAFAAAATTFSDAPPAAGYSALPAP